MKTLFRPILLALAVWLVIQAVTVTPSQGASSPGVHTQNNLVVDTSGARLVIKGVVVEAYRDYAGGCGYVTDNLFKTNASGGSTNLTLMVNKFKALGVNTVRLAYNWHYLNTSAYPNLSHYLDIAQALANAGIYVMPSDWGEASTNLAQRAQSYPTFKAIVDGFRARGIEPYLIFNPFNEPTNLSWSEWVPANKEALAYLRNTAGFRGIVILDTIGWASQNDATSFQDIRTYDASLLGGTANVGFSNHIYPNAPATRIDDGIAFGKTFPMVVGEMGQINPGVSGLDPNYVINVLNEEVQVGIPSGHNGTFAWMWNWCDDNDMTTAGQNYTDLNAYGQLYPTYYWNKVGTPPQPSPTLTTAATRTPTPLRTATRAPTMTTTPVASPTRTATSKPTSMATATVKRTAAPSPTRQPTATRSGYRVGLPYIIR